MSTRAGTRARRRRSRCARSPGAGRPHAMKRSMTCCSTGRRIRPDSRSSPAWRLAHCQSALARELRGRYTPTLGAARSPDVHRRLPTQGQTRAGCPRQRDRRSACYVRIALREAVNRVCETDVVQRLDAVRLGRLGRGAQSPSRPGLLHAPPVLPAHLEQRVRDLPERADAHRIHQHRKEMGPRRSALTARWTRTDCQRACARWQSAGHRGR